MDISRLWIIIFVICIIFEIIKMNLYGTSIGAGSIAAEIAALLQLHPFFQLGIFLLVLLIFLFIVRPIGLRSINKAKSQSYLAELIGQSAVVISEIDNSQHIGRVSINDTEWAARSARKDLTYQTGTVVKIIDIYGGKLIVKK